MISEHSRAKPDLSPSQENSAEDSQKSLFKVEKVLSVSIPISRDLHLWLHFQPVQLGYNPPTGHINF